MGQDYVLQFDVSVDDVMTVQIGHTAYQFPEDDRSGLFRKDPFLELLVELAIAAQLAEEVDAHPYT